MPGTSKSTSVLRHEGTAHRTKAELAFREAAEKALQTEETFAETPEVQADPIAHNEFLRLQRLYAQIDIVGALDQQIICRYCLEVSNLQKLQAMLDTISADLSNIEDVAQRVKVYEASHRVQVAMSKSKDMLLKLEDRLFLTPTTRIRAVPKTPPKPEKLTGIAAYRARWKERDDDRGMADYLARLEQRRADEQYNQQEAEELNDH